MRHHKRNRTLRRDNKERRALLKALAVSLIMKGKITTTEAKAKELRPVLERLITYGKKGTLDARRRVISAIGPKAGGRLVKVIAPKYMERSGGYLRITKIVRRLQDGAHQAVIEFV